MDTVGQDAGVRTEIRGVDVRKMAAKSTDDRRTGTHLGKDLEPIYLK